MNAAVLQKRSINEMPRNYRFTKRKLALIQVSPKAPPRPGALRSHVGTFLVLEMGIYGRRRASRIWEACLSLEHLGSGAH